MKDLDCEMFYLTTLFANIRLDDAVVLDIGGGMVNSVSMQPVWAPKKSFVLNLKRQGANRISKKVI